MKRIFIFLLFAAFSNVCVHSQNVVELGEKFIESDISEVRRHLNRDEQGFSFYSTEELRVLGHDPNATIIGAKGNNPSNALTVIAKAYGTALEESYIEEVTFILTPLYGNRVVSDLSGKGYVQSNTRSFLADNKWTLTEKIYKKTNIIAVTTFSSKGECMSVVFSKTKNQTNERQREEEAHRQSEQEEQRKQQEAISNRVSNVFGSGSSQDARQGNASTGTASLGSPFAGSNYGTNQDSGVIGSFNLNGRSVGSGGLPQPRCSNKYIQENGRVVVNITVDPNGNVIQAEIGRGTNIESIITRECALDAAERAKFNRIQGANNQSGTITYNYTFQNQTARTTNQGNPSGNSESGANLGIGGFLGSFNINERSIGAGGLPKPAYTGGEEGRIVVNITVDPSGNVIHAEIGRGTNIDNASMRKSALEAAYRAKFNKISGQNKQSGTITYNYRLN